MHSTDGLIASEGLKYSKRDGFSVAQMESRKLSAYLLGLGESCVCWTCLTSIGVDM